MDIQYKGTRYEPTPDIIEQADRQIGALDRFLGGAAAQAHLELDRAVGSKKKGDVWRAELTVDCEGKRYRAESIKTKLDHAVTTVVRDVARELERAKRKEHIFMRKGRAAIKDFLRFGQE